MKNNKFIILSALLALSAATPAEAQIDAADSTQVNVAFRKLPRKTFWVVSQALTTEN